MKKLSVYLTVLLFAFLGKHLQAQGHYEVTPSNVVHQAEEIYEDYEDQITISLETITSYLEELSHPDTYNPSHTNSTLELMDIGPTTISVNWQAQAEATWYEVTYLNLNTGASEIVTVPSTTTEFTFQNVGDALYLLSITSFYDNGGHVESSFVDIIIIEEKVFILFEDDEGYICDCPAEQVIYHASGDQGLSNVIIDWNPYPGEEYVLAIEYMDGSWSSFFNYEVQKNFNDLGPGNVFNALIKVLCLGNLLPDFPTILGYNSELTINLAATSENYSWVLSHTFPVMKSVTLKTCAGIDEEEISSKEFRMTRNTQMLYPNPTTDFINIILENENPESLNQIEIFDQSGKLWHRIKTDAAQEYLDVSNFPGGIYQVNINNGNKMQTERFLKIN